MLAPYGETKGTETSYLSKSNHFEAAPICEEWHPLENQHLVNQARLDWKNLVLNSKSCKYSKDVQQRFGSACVYPPALLIHCLLPFDCPMSAQSGVSQFDAGGQKRI